MARAGSFDSSLESAGWFDEILQPPGWFDEHLISTARVRISWLQITGIQRRAVILRSSALCQILDSEIGTSLKPIVLLGGVLKQRGTTEGLPIVVNSDGNLRTLQSGESLLL